MITSRRQLDIVKHPPWTWDVRAFAKNRSDFKARGQLERIDKLSNTQF